jgi:hypothetical protein
VTAADRPYGKFYDFYSVSLETFGSTHVCNEMEHGGQHRDVISGFVNKIKLKFQPWL